MNHRTVVWGMICGLLAEASGCGTSVPRPDPIVEIVERTDYHRPKPVSEELVDDQLSDKQTTFSAELVDRRPLDGWLVNQSEAVIRLDVPLIKPDQEPHLTTLHPSYAVATQAARENPRYLNGQQSLMSQPPNSNPPHEF